MRGLKIAQSITNRDDASLNIFFKEVSKLPRINPDQEIELANKIQEGDENAINKLVEANLRFVISVAKQYQNKGLPLVDLIQEGVFGCREAAKRWDPTRGFKFISYAVCWIRQAIIKAISDQCRTIRMPMNQVVYMTKINKAVEEFEQLNSRKPTVEELSEITDISTYKIIQNMAASSKTTSLDNPFKNEEEDCLLDIIPNQNINATDSNLIENSISKEIENVLNNLSNRESDVLRMSFGLGMSEMTLEEIGIRFGTCTERIRQIKHEALEKIKLKYKNKLIDLL